MSRVCLVTKSAPDHANMSQLGSYTRVQSTTCRSDYSCRRVTIRSHDSFAPMAAESAAWQHGKPPIYQVKASAPANALTDTVPSRS